MSPDSLDPFGPSAIRAPAEQIEREFSRIDSRSLHRWAETSWGKNTTGDDGDRIDEAELERLGIRPVEDNAFRYGECIYYYLSDALAAARWDDKK